MLYGTTKEFLEFFNLRDLKDLPTLREFHELSEEHQAQVAALEGVAPEGTIEREGEEARRRPSAAADAPRDRRRRPRTSTSSRRSIGSSAPPGSPPITISQPWPSTAAPPDEFEHEPTRDYDPVAGEPTRLHANTIPTPEIVDEEFDHSETTSKKLRPEGLDPAVADHADDESEAH